MSRRPIISRKILALAIALPLLGGGCGDSEPMTAPDAPGTGPAHLSVRITDAPANMLESATIEVGAVEAIQAGGPPILLTESAGEYDLLQLTDGVSAELAAADVQAGTLHQIRLEILSAEVVLSDGYQFRDGSTTQSLQVPSGKIKVNLAHADGDEAGEEEGLEAGAGEETTVMLDFDVTRNFVVQGNPDTPAGIQGFLFKPLVRVAREGKAGTISGTVTGPEGTVEGLTVTAAPAGASDLTEDQTDVASAQTDADGNYEIHFVPAGTYAVTVEAPDGLTPDPDSHTVTVKKNKSVGGVDFDLLGGDAGSEGSGEGGEGSDGSGGDTTGGDASLSPGLLVLKLTDAPTDILESATIVVNGGEAVVKGGPHVPLPDMVGEFDLLDLQDGLTADLGTAELDPGTLLQLRLFIESATVSIKEELDLTFKNGEKEADAKVPSGIIRINMSQVGDAPSDGEGEDTTGDPAGEDSSGEGEGTTGGSALVDGTGEDNGEGEGTDIEPGEMLSLVIDIDVNRSFVIQGNPNTPSGLKGVMLKPVVRIAREDGAGSISGTVTGPDGPLAGVTVNAEPVVEGDLTADQTDVAAGITDESGQYTIHYLPPGTYRVTVVPPDGFTSAEPETEVTLGEDETMTGVDFQLQAEDATGSS